MIQIKGKMGTVLCLLMLLNIQIASAAETSVANGLCFDFNSPVKVPLGKSTEFNPKKDFTKSGKFSSPKTGIWGLVQGEVNRPIEKIYEQLLDHFTVKDSKRVKLRVYPQERSGFQDFHLVMVTLPTPLMDVKWEEEWGYVITDGTEANPKTVVISYQKSNGTKYVPRLCGSIVLKFTSPTSTNVYLYEEIDSLGKRSHKDTVQGHLGTLKVLRQGKS
jgi:hypothetical protein